MYVKKKNEEVQDGGVEKGFTKMPKEATRSGVLARENIGGRKETDDEAIRGSEGDTSERPEKESGVT